ncbi:hypothetical protein JYG23_09440 [Sedimentibacter sp. zth1]|uniref:hypothetical protein n=1 Tax=Sedimentibacter sp. zth1 TaxID=2816908 RepID=UPI001A930FA6|nr:hypothetical protein [Sedimentibacter sp. zth1]QSX04914.1 hypothetical protein JYG23_09440 [Sedimentibacter sp. zth1]
MKQFIVLSAVLILLIALFLQIPLEMVNYEKKNAVMFYVNNAKEKAKQEGYYTDVIIDELKSNIAKTMSIENEDKIIIDNKTTTSPKYRQNKYQEGEEIYLRISIPFDNIIAAHAFYGLEKEKRYLVIENITTSERLVKNK